MPMPTVELIEIKLKLSRLNEMSLFPSLSRQRLRTQAFDEDYEFWFDFHSDGSRKGKGFKCYVRGEAANGGPAPSTAAPTESTPFETTPVSPTTPGPSGRFQFASSSL